MCREKRKLPIGIENFEQIIKDDFYYVDKTGLISELLRNWGMVNLFTRPRRFGKSLNMSMLEHFFSVEGDKSIFDGLKISKDKKLCEEYMGKHPVISISLKGINAASYEAAFELTVKTIKGAVQKAGFLKMSDKLGEDEKKEYRAILDENMSEATLFWSLKNLSELLEKHYETKVILLIDEYDVPLAKAFENGYYDKMVFLIRNLLEQTLKTNNSLKFAVMTGCMRISKESIFTGLNNLKVLSITDERFDEYFGFTDEDVKEMLRYYDREDHYEEMRNWYDGYRFGSTDVYCPWDVLNHCDKIKENAAAFPENYWVHTSSNEAVKKIIQMSGNITTKREIERLLAGEEIVKEIRQELTAAVESRSWNEMLMFQQESERLLDATLDMDGVMVGTQIEKIHNEYISVIQYHNENSLSSVLTIAYLSAMQYYFKPIRELPTGRGFADFVYIPKPEYKADYPALIVELKWNQKAQTAIQQIKNKKYPTAIEKYTGDILLVGISYDKNCKEHQCLIEKYEKES